MSEEWQAKQLLLATSEPGPAGSMRSPSGRSMVTDLSTNLSSACASNGASTPTAMRATGSAWRNIFPSSGYHNGRLLDDVAHEAAWIPIGRAGLRLAAAARASR